jgi:hypothetical protein
MKNILFYGGIIRFRTQKNRADRRKFFAVNCKRQTEKPLNAVYGLPVFAV